MHEYRYLGGHVATLHLHIAFLVKKSEFEKSRSDLSIGCISYFNSRVFSAGISLV